jgi:hypothetical protein
MDAVNKILDIFGYQLIKNNVKLPTKSVKSPKIQDNNQSIKNGIINESKPNPTLRSKTKPKPILKRGIKS